MVLINHVAPNYCLSYCLFIINKNGAYTERWGISNQGTSMKSIIIGLTLITSMQAFAGNVVEAYHLKSSKSYGYPDLLIKVLDNGTCSSETSNFDGSKDVIEWECEVSQSEFKTFKTLRLSTCSPDQHQDPDFPETVEITRGRNTLTLGGITLVKASSKVLRDYRNMRTCN